MDSNNNICKQIDECLDAFHDGELSASEAAKVEEHLQSCGHCTAKLTEIDRLVSALRALPRESAPSGLSNKLDNIIDQRSKIVAWRTRTAWASATVAAVAVVLVGMRSWMPANQAETNVAKVPDKVTEKIAKSTPQATPDEAKPTPRSEEVIANVPDGGRSEPVVGGRPGWEGPMLNGPPNDYEVSEANPVIAQGPPENRSITTLHELTGVNKLIADAPQVKSIATKHGASDALISTPASEEIAELPTSTNSFTDAVGLATDEDGLYDIQM